MLYCWQVVEDPDLDGNSRLSSIVVVAATEDVARRKAAMKAANSHMKGKFSRVLQGPPSIIASDSDGVVIP